MSSLSLKEQLAARKPECFESDNNGRSFIELQPTPDTRHGFALAQLLHYTLEANPAPGADAPERLTLAFSTADVVILGARLVRLTDLLREHKLAIVRPLSDRYSNLEPTQPWVAEILIRRLDKSGGAAS
jgi:hypothetical protein